MKNQILSDKRKKKFDRLAAELKANASIEINEELFKTGQEANAKVEQKNEVVEPRVDE